MIRVSDQGKSMGFYTRILGMKILRLNEYPDGRFTNTFVGYQGEDDGKTIEMTYNWDQEEPYDMGNVWATLH
jgi:lactoylglutathione lyase